VSGLDVTTAMRAAERDAAEETFATLPRGELLLGYQQRVLTKLMSGVSLLVIEKSRRIGLTWAMAAYFVLVAAAQRSAGGDNCWYMGYDMEMAREFIDACAMWARAFGIAAEDADEEVLHDDDKPVGAFRIRFSSGFKIVALPSVPRALRGKQGKVGIDEAAFHKNIGETLKSAIALLMWSGQVIVWSTHDGVSNPFNILLDEIKAGERKGAWIRIDFDDAIADGLYERVALAARIKGRSILPKEEWISDIFDTYGEDAEEELRCIPKAGSGTLIKPEDLAACEHPEAGKAELYSGGLAYLGRDVARRRDGAIQWTFELIGDVLWLRDRYEEVGTSFAHQDAHFDQQFATRRIAAAWIDQTGMGEKVVEDAQRRHGETRVVGQLLTGPTRLDLAISLADRFQRGLIRIPPDPIIRADFRAIKRAASEGGGVRIVNDGEVHADRFWAAALASRAADLPQAMYAYRSVPKALWGEQRLDGGDPDFEKRHPQRKSSRSSHGRFGSGAF
jgi:phage FluMu gp28-like protein